MLTIKHVTKNQQHIYGCEEFHRDLRDPRVVVIASRGVGRKEIELDDGDVVFVENHSGKTIDTVRA